MEITIRAEMTAEVKEKREAVKILQKSVVISRTLPDLFLLCAHASDVIFFLALFCLISFCNYFTFWLNFKQNCRTDSRKSICKLMMTRGNLIFSCQNWNIGQLYANRSCVFRIICISGLICWSFDWSSVYFWYCSVQTDWGAMEWLTSL